MVLNTVDLGESGSRVVFCHGLFGQGKNFTAIGKVLADDHRVTLVDMPDHGRSPRTDGFDYLAYADLVAELLSPDDPVALVGHSMGGKVAMLLALRHPELVERLVVVDVAPVPYDHAAEFEGYIAAMRAIDLATLASRAEADSALSRGRAVVDGARLPAPEPAPRGRRVASWLLNLDVLGRDLDLVTGWPEVDAGAVRRAGAVGRRRGLALRRARARRRDGPAVPAQPPGDRQGRRPLGALASSPRCSSRCSGGSSRPARSAPMSRGIRSWLPYASRRSRECGFRLGSRRAPVWLFRRAGSGL